MVEECFARVHRSVTVGVGQNGNATNGLIFALAVHVRHVAAHLDDPQAALRIELRDDGIFNERIGCADLDAVTFG